VVVHSVTGILPGLYKYDEMEHRLLPKSQGDVRPAFREACMGQEMVSDAQALFIWVAVRSRMGDRYAARAYRYLFLDLGHAAENLALAAESLLLGCCSIGAYYDEYTDAIMGLDGEKETVSYMTVVGRKR
jgi:SagB-type dehydrogenase family enzyme